MCVRVFGSMLYSIMLTGVGMIEVGGFIETFETADKISDRFFTCSN